MILLDVGLIYTTVGPGAAAATAFAPLSAPAASLIIDNKCLRVDTTGSTSRDGKCGTSTGTSNTVINLATGMNGN